MALELLSSNELEYLEVINELEKNNSKTAIYSDMIIKLKSKEWKLSTQELHYISKHKDNMLEYLEFRYSFWKSLYFPEYGKVSDFPLYLVIEPTSICNLRCKMCWQQDPIIRTPQYKGQMKFDIFKQIVDEAYENGCRAITFAGRGEPLVNSNICKFLDYAAGKFFELKINTNGLLLTEEICQSIIKANVSLLVFSAEGTTQDEYKKTRCGGSLEKLLDNIEMFNRIREKYSENSTQTRVSGVITDMNMDKQKYFDFWKKYVDEVALVELEERNDTYHNTIICEKPCYRLWQQMYVWWDGSCSPCDNDYLQKIDLGAIVGKSVKEIWNSRKYNVIRNLHKNGKRKNIIPCDRCGI